MIPFPGESVSIDSFSASGVTGGGLFELSYRAGSATFATGAVADITTGFFTNYLDSADEPGEVAWAVEILSGSGTLHLEEGLNTLTTDLGTHTVAAGGTLAVPSGFTISDVYNQVDTGVLRITCDAGPVVVQQVKLRVWPPGGPVGDWSDLHPAWTWDDQLPAARTVERPLNFAISRSGPRSISDAWGTDLGAVIPTMDLPLEGGIDDLPAELSPDVGVNGSAHVEINATSTSEPSPGESGLSVGGFFFGALVRREQRTPTINPAEGLVDGVDYTASPYEVWADPAAFASATGTPENFWNPTEVRWEQDGGNYDGDTLPQLVAMEWTELHHPDGLPFILWPDFETGPPASFDMPNLDLVFVAPSHYWLRVAPAQPSVPNPTAYSVDLNNGYGWQLGQAVFNPEGLNEAPLTYRTAMPAYRLWNPTPAQPLRLMQRGDGLGMGSGRLLGAGTRQNSTRLYGSL